MKRWAACVLCAVLLSSCGAAERPPDYAALAAEWLSGDISFTAELCYPEDNSATVILERAGEALELCFLSPEPLAGLSVAVQGGALTLEYAGHSVPLAGELPEQSPVAALVGLFAAQRLPELSVQEGDTVIVSGGVYIDSFELEFSADMELLGFAFPNLGITGRAA